MEDLQFTIVQQQQRHEEKLLQMMELHKRTQDTKPARFFSPGCCG